MHFLTLSILLGAAATLTLATPKPVSVADITAGPHTIEKRASGCDCPSIGGDCFIWGYWYPGSDVGVAVCTSHSNNTNHYVCSGTYDSPNCNVCAQSQGYDYPEKNMCSGTPVCYKHCSACDVPQYKQCTDCQLVEGSDVSAGRPPADQPLEDTGVSQCDN